MSVASAAPARVPWPLRLERARARALFLLIRSLVRQIPFAHLRTLGACLGEVQYRGGFVERRRIEREVATLLALPAGDPRIRAIIREAYRTNDAAVLEILKIFDRPQDRTMLLDRVQVDGQDRLRDALAAGRGAILLGGHAGNGALAVIRLVATGFPVSVVYHQARMSDGDLFDRGMKAYGIDAILANDGLKAYGRMLSAVRHNRVLFVMADQGTKKMRDGMLVRFLGKDMPMPAGPAQLARHSKAPVLPLATVATSPRWQFEILAPIASILDGGLEGTVDALLRASERLILRDPQWWSWHHRRWRHYPLATDAARGQTGPS